MVCSLKFEKDAYLKNVALDFVLFGFEAIPHSSCYIQFWTKGLRQICEIKQIGFSMDCFTDEFLRFFTEKRQNLALGWAAGYSPSNRSISGIFLKFPIVWAQRPAQRPARFTTCGEEKLCRKREKVYKCFVQDCLFQDCHTPWSSYYWFFCATSTAF